MVKHQQRNENMATNEEIIWCPYEVNHFQRGICNLCGEVKSKHLTFKEFKKKRDMEYKKVN